MEHSLLRISAGEGEGRIWTQPLTFELLATLKQSQSILYDKPSSNLGCPEAEPKTSIQVYSELHGGPSKDTFT